VSIPAPPVDQVFDPLRVNVSIVDGTGALVSLGYDENCATPEAWRFDDPSNPNAIVLCDGSCSAVQADVTARLNVEFGCKTRPPR
jgi:hypothetical protein